MRFKEKLISKIKELRDENHMQQKDLANLLGVSRQTIYYLEKGIYNPKLTLSLNIARIFNKITEEIFFLEPIIRKIIGGITIDQLDKISKDIGISKERIEDLRKISNEELEKKYTRKELTDLSNALDLKFEDLFEE